MTRNAIARLLAARDWSDAQLAARAGVGRAHLNQLKNGRALPTVASALAIAHALGVPVAIAFPPGSSARRRPPRAAAGRSSHGRQQTTPSA